MGLLIIGLVVAAVASWVSARRARESLDAVERALGDHEREIELLKTQVARLSQRGSSTAPDAAAVRARHPVEDLRPARVPDMPAVISPSEPASWPARPLPHGAPAAPHRNQWLASEEQTTPRPGSMPAPEALPTRDLAGPDFLPAAAPPDAPAVPFDLESLVGVKLFSAIAGVALALAAIFFLRYSVDHGWLQPPVRVAIGIVVAVALLVVCELKAARRYRVTANALDAAAVAVLFSTVFAAHALWNLIPAAAAFVLLGGVAALAAFLAIRRESIFIAVLGLLGGFATPALLSSGENRPIALFAYLMLLNVGLAWVAYRQTWPLLTALTLVLTTLYQWVWVIRFLDAASLTLGMGIFVVFPLVTLAGLVLAERPVPGAAGPRANRRFENTAVLAAALPLFFAVYLTTVPAYGDRPGLLFGFLLLVDAGLFAVAVARAQPVLHAAGALAALVVFGTWLAVSHSGGNWVAPLAWSAVFVAFFTAAPVAAALLRRPFDDPRGEMAAPLLLFVPAVLARIELAPAVTLPLFATLFALVGLVAWRAIAARRGSLYYVAAFFAVAAQAAWSSTHLSAARLSSVVVIYAVFGVSSALVPIAARRVGRPLEPRAGSGIVLIASLTLLLFLSFGTSSLAGLWALALLLAIMNAVLFVESGSAGLPMVSIAGSLLSWLVLQVWWMRAAAAIGIVPSLTVLTGLTLVTFAGHTWVSRRHPATPAISAEPRRPGFADGLYLGLIGDLFLFAVAVHPAWSLPPWPLFATLAILTVAATVASFLTKRASLHAAAVIAAAAIVTAWTAAAGAPWAPVALMAGAAVTVYSLIWMVIAGDAVAPRAAAGGLFVGEFTAILASAGGAAIFPGLVVTHVANLAVLLALTWRHRWPLVAIGAVLTGWYAVAIQWGAFNLADGWARLLVLSLAMYGVFVGYPLVLGRRARAERDPYTAAVLASAAFFFPARAAIAAGGYGWLIGVLPIGEAGVLALLLRQLLRNESAGQRDLGRLALVAGAALAFVTVAIPLQLHRQWITIGWALEAAALVWLFGRVPHRGLFIKALALFGAVFVRLALNPAVFDYVPRGSLRIFNWYLYAYLLCAAAFSFAGWRLSRTEARIPVLGLRPSPVLAGCGFILLFLLLNIEIADFFATGSAVMFRFGVSVVQDLTYTIGWLVFGMGLLAACIYLHNRFGRVAALALIAVTTFKCFLYDLGSLGGLYRVASFVGLAMSLALVSLALQKFVIRPVTEP